MWGSFLNVIAYRLLSGDSLFKPRSFCPACGRTLTWYELVPLFSWVLLRGSCRTCNTPISRLYPFIELLSALSFFLLAIQVPPFWWLGYGIFFSLLLISVRTDLQAMLISRWVTVCALPIPFLLSFFHFLPLAILHSVIGCISAAIFLQTIKCGFKWCTGRDGLGQGDIDLLMLIGSFTGFLGWWSALFFGSTAGTLYAMVLLVQKKSLLQRIPFGPFLALGAALYVLYPQLTLRFFSLA